MCVLRPSPPPVGATSLFPAKREVKREVAKAWQAWPGNQTSPRSLVRSLVCVAGRAPRPHVSKEVSDGASNGGAQCSHRVSEAQVAARAGLPQAGARPAQSICRKIGVKKSRPRFPLRRLYAKPSQTTVFGFAVGFKKLCRRRLERRAARAPSPPRLAAGAGDRNAETLKDFYVLGLLDAISSRLFFGSAPSAFQIFRNES